MTTPHYPLSDHATDSLRSLSGRRLGDLTVDAVLADEVSIEDGRIAPETLRAQASIARDAGRASMAENFERAAEMVALTDQEILQIYELLRPGRAASADSLREVAARLREQHSAHRLAVFIEEAADAYVRRGLFQTRY